jgi:hypothetical protein
MKHTLLLSLCLLTSFSMQAANDLGLINEQPTPSDKTAHTLLALVGMHCVDAYTNSTFKHCSRSDRCRFNCCKACVCVGMAHSLSTEITTLCGVENEPLIRHSFMVGIDFALLQLIQGAQQIFSGTKSKND